MFLVFRLTIQLLVVTLVSGNHLKLLLGTLKMEADFSWDKNSLFFQKIATLAVFTKK